MDSEQLAELAAEACDDRKAIDILLIRVDEVSSLADWLVISAGNTDVQVRAISRSVEDKLKDQAKIKPFRKEGLNEGKWVLMDYGEVIVHVLQPKERGYYDLESYWSHGESHTFQLPNK